MKPEVLKVIENVHEIFKGKGLTLSVAESCTGGLISHWLTSLPGASKFFMAGVIAYSEKAKKDIINVSAETVKLHGMVSDETVRDMAEKVRVLANTDYSLATTGNLGPDMIEAKKSGLIYIAVSMEEKSRVQELQLNGRREENKEAASLSALRLLVDVLVGK